MTYTASEIHQYLQQKMGVRYENKLYGYEEGNHIGLSNFYLFDTPHDYWTRPGPLREGHSERFVTEVRETISSAERWIDIVTMNAPDGALYDAIVHGLVKLAIEKREVTVRFLVGMDIGQGQMNTAQKLRDIARLLVGRASKLTIQFGQYRWQRASWGHAKFIAVDGERLLNGGHNLWSKDYLEADPVFDLTLRYDGPIAMGAHRFADELWEYVRRNQHHGNPDWMTYSNRLRPDLTVTEDKPPVRPNWSTRRLGSMPALWVTLPGWDVFREGRFNVSWASGVLALERALSNGTTCVMSQQDFGATWKSTRNYQLHETRADHDYPYDLLGCDNCFFIEPLIQAIVGFLGKDSTTLSIVMTRPEKRGRGYTNKIPFSALFNLVGYYLGRRFRLTKEQVLAKLNRQFLIKTISFSGGRHDWPSGDPKYNHAKFWMIDDLAYVGSENLYPSVAPGSLIGLLQEFGVITELSANAKAMLLKDYFNPMFDNGVRHEAKLSDLTWPV